MVLLSFVLAVALAGVHLLVERMPFLRITPRRRWLSFAGGTSVAYVFVHIFPEMSEHQTVFGEPAWRLLEDAHVYVLSLVGFCAFYGLERAVQRFGGMARGLSHDETRRRIEVGVFSIHITAFALSYVLIGYLLVHRDVPGPANLILFALAMGLHFVVIDIGLTSHHRAIYHRYGRWALSGAVLLGWGLSWVGPLPPTALAALFAILAGGIILNAIKEELPGHRESRFWAFAVGALTFAGLLLAIPGL